MCPDEPNRHLGHDDANQHPNVANRINAGAGSAGVTVPPTARSHSNRTGQNLVLRGVRRDPPDLHKLAEVLASLTTEMLEEETEGPASNEAQ